MKIFVATTISAVLIIVAFMLTRGNAVRLPAENVNNVSIVDGKQIIDLTAKGGYSPRKSVAKAGIPTIVRFTTSGTFDCSSVVRIPSLDVSKNLAMSGTTDIDLGVPKLGLLEGSCGMGMYPFEIDFQS
ncbi:MAG: cupredoxin domain-containing protein [Candidatus Paceibacterota bacterium]